MPFPVFGKIGSRWLGWGGENGPFGAPLGLEEGVPGHNGRRQTFTHGEIAFSPDQDMVVSVFHLRNEALFEWEQGNPGFESFRYDIRHNGVSQGQADRFSQRGSTQRWVRLQGLGEYSFVVKGCTGSDGDDCNGGFTIPVRVQFRPLQTTPDPAIEIPAGGVIGEQWHQLGAWEGPLGRPVSPEAFQGGGLRQLFEHGSIVTAPEFGPEMVVSVFQRHDFFEVNRVEIEWGGANRPFNGFRVDIYAGGRKVWEEVVWRPIDDLWARTGRGSGHLILPDAVAKLGDGNLFVFVFPILTSSFVPPTPFDFPQTVPTEDGPPSGATPAARVKLKLGVIDVKLEPPAIAATPAHAFASLKPRRNAVARHFARTRPIHVAFREASRATEDDSVQLLAHLHMVARDRDFRVPGELPSRILAIVRLRQLLWGNMGTHFDETLVDFTIFDIGLGEVKVSRDGDYDMALKGVLTILYRHRSLLTEELREILLRNLAPPHLVGAHVPELEVVELDSLEIDTPLGDVGLPIPKIEFPETENHLLMMESSRYLLNQIFFDRTAHEKFNNKTNGLRNWLLEQIQRLAKHDLLEFNARPYNRLSIHVLLNLFEFARDEELRTGAQIVLDYLFVKFAISSNRQRRVAPFRRLQENRNSPFKINDLIFDAIGGDPMTGFFMIFTGPIDPAGKPFVFHPISQGFTGLLSGLSTYVPPVAAYVLALSDIPAVQHRFYHGTRPRLSGTTEIADGGVEIYFKSPSFLVTAGGMFLNSGYGRDEFQKFKQVAVAQSTTLIPTRADVLFADLIRIDSYPDPPAAADSNDPFRGTAVNTAVHRGFASGANVRVPERWLRLTGAVQENRWLFLDLNRNTPELRLGFYVAVYRAPVERPEDLDPAPDNVGFFYAMEATSPAGAVMSFEDFRRLTLERNGHLPLEFTFGGVHDFHAPDDRTFRFRFLPISEKYIPRVFPLDEPDPVTDYRTLPLVEGPFLSSRGDDGVITGGVLHVRYPGCAAPLVLDFSEALHPDRKGEACAAELIDRARALREEAQQWLGLSQLAAGEGRRSDAIEAAKTAVEVLRGFTPLPSEEAEHVNKLAVSLFVVAQRLLEAKRLGEVSQPAMESVATFRVAAERGVNPMTFTSLLLSLSQQLTAAGLTEDAVEPARAAADTLRAFRPSPSDLLEYLRLFSASLLFLTQRSLEANRPSDAAVSSREMVAVSRRLADTPGADRMGIARNLLIVSQLLSTALLRAEAVETAEAAADVLRTQPPGVPEAEYLPLFGAALFTLAQRLIEAGRIEEVSVPALESVETFRLAAERGVNPMTFTSLLLSLSQQLTVAGLTEDAVEPARAAADTLRAFRPSPSDLLEYLRLFSASLLFLTQRSLEADRPSDAAVSSREMVAVSRRLADTPGADRMGIARNLLIVSQLLSTALLRAEAVETAEAAADVLRTQPPGVPEAEYLSLSGAALFTLAQRLIEAGSIEEVSVPATEAIAVLRDAAEAGADRASIGSLLRSLSTQLATVGLAEESKAAAQAADEISPL